MPNSRSAKKSHRQSVRRGKRNRTDRGALRTLLKKTEATIAEGGDSTEALKATAKALDQAAANNLIHKNAAARKKSRLVRRAAKAAPK